MNSFGGMGVFVVNRSLDSGCDIDLKITGYENFRPVCHISPEGDGGIPENFGECQR